MSGEWWDVGFEGEHIERAKREATKKQRRFYMKNDTSRDLIFLDDEPFCITEHNPRINGTWKDNWFTCRRGMEDDPRCPLCMSNVKRYFVGFLTVLDTTGFVGDDGKEIKNLPYLYPLKMESLKLVKQLKREYETLVNAKFTVSRTSGKAPNIGNMFAFKGYVDINSDEFKYTSRLDGKRYSPEPFEYKKILEPIGFDEMRALGVGMDDSNSGSSSSSGKDEGGDDDVPYV